MTTALQKVEPINQLPASIKGLSEKDLKELMEISKHLAAAPFYQKMGPGGVLAIWLTAKEMGLPPMMCLNGGMYTFSGQVTLSAKVINMLLLRAGHRTEVLKLDEESCKIKFIRGDRKKEQGAEFIYEYTMEDAKKAGLTGKKNWQTNPRDMLYNRCLSGGAIKHMPDATNGAYVIGEMPGDGEIIDVIPDDVLLPKVEEKSKLSVEQVIELQNLLLQCDPEFQKKVKTVYLAKKYKVSLLDEVAASEFGLLKGAFEEKAREYQKQLAEAEMNNVKEIENDK